MEEGVSSLFDEESPSRVGWAFFGGINEKATK